MVRSKVGVNPSLGKESELFGVDLNTVNNLKAGLIPPALGKKTTSLLLDQIDYMTSYPCHSNHKTTDNLADFVEVVTDLNQHRQGIKAGMRDIGWKSETRNTLEYIISSGDVSTAFS